MYGSSLFRMKKKCILTFFGKMNVVTVTTSKWFYLVFYLKYKTFQLTNDTIYLFTLSDEVMLKTIYNYYRR